MNYDLTCSQMNLLGGLETFLPSLDHQGIYRFYIKPSAWHHVFVIITTFLDDEKLCRNCEDTGTNRAKTFMVVSAGQNGCG